LTKIIVDKDDIEIALSMLECNDFEEAERILRAVLKESEKC